MLGRNRWKRTPPPPAETACEDNAPRRMSRRRPGPSLPRAAWADSRGINKTRRRGSDKCNRRRLWGGFGFFSSSRWSESEVQSDRSCESKQDSRIRPKRTAASAAAVTLRQRRPNLFLTPSFHVLTWEIEMSARCCRAPA